MSNHKIVIGYQRFRTSPTKIVAEINKRLGEGAAELVYYTGEKDIITSNSDFFVNWGYADRIWKTHRCPDLNNRNTIENKADQKRALQKAGIRTPKLFPIAEYPGIPCVLRLMSHHGGVDAKYVETKEDWDKAKRKFEGGYAMEFVDKVAEFRAHSTSGPFLYATKKCIKNQNLLCWNNADERVLGSMKRDDVMIRRLRLLGRRAIKAIGYDFGGVDIIMDEAGMLWVLEVNSAPALETEAAVNVYVDYILGEAKVADYEG